MIFGMGKVFDMYEVTMNLTFISATGSKPFSCFSFSSDFLRNYYVYRAADIGIYQILQSFSYNQNLDTSRMSDQWAITD